MKLSELKPCSCCKGALIKPPVGFWYCVRVSQVMLMPRATNATMGLMQMLGGRDDAWTLKIAETLSPDAECAMILGDKDRALMTELHICFDCWVKRFGGLNGLVEKRGRPDEPAGEGGAPSSAAEAHHMADLSVGE